jgi:protein-S-isoprenylcysteine O-methyltransferase Ste14
MAVATVEDIKARFSVWYLRESASPHYDVTMRLPALAYFGFAIWAQAQSTANVLLVDHGLPDDLRIITVLARTATLVVFLSFAVLTIVRRKPIARSNGLWPRFVAIGAVGCLFANAFLRHPEPSYAWELSSALMIALSGALTCFVVVRLGRSFSTMPEARALVTTGPYRYVRHPLYVAEELAIIGVFLQNRSLIALCLLIVQFWLQLQRMRCEEKVLAEAFPSYSDYCRRTARLLPGIY